MAVSRKRKIMADDEKKNNNNNASSTTTKRSTKKRLVAGKHYNNLRPWSNLHIDMLSLIMRALSTADRIRARAVCKSWWLLQLNEIPTGSSNHEDQLPWIMSFEWRKTYEAYVLSTCRLHDPCYKKQKPYIIEEDITRDGTRDKFVGATICSAKQGWVMFYHRTTIESTCSFFLYCPFTKDIITLPDSSIRYNSFYRGFNLATFSSSPTSSDCVIFVLVKSTCGKVIISTCRCHDKTWSTHELSHVVDQTIIYEDAVYVDGTFYCVSSDGTLAAFKEAHHDWTQLTDFKPLLPDFRAKAYLVESNGELLMVYKWHKTYRIYVFDQSRKGWIPKQDLGNRALFLGWCSSYSASAAGHGEASNIGNNVYFHNNGITYFYSFRDRKIRECSGPNNVYCWVLNDEGIQRIWIQPPRL